jgi:hypothetical protein
MAKKKIDEAELEQEVDEAVETIQVPTKKTKKVQAHVSDLDTFANDMSSFLEKSCGLEIQTLNQRDEINYWINSGSYAMNWIIGDSFFEGLPGSKSILLAGECLGPDEEITIKIPEKLLQYL